MAEIMTTIFNQIQMYYGDAVLLVLAVMSCLYLFAHSEENKNRFLYPILLIVICIVNPIAYKLILYKIDLWQMCWMLPNAIIIALAFVKMVQDCTKRREKAVVLVALSLLLVWKGSNIYQSGKFTLIQNWEKETDTWTITQYASTTGAIQQMFYTIEDRKGNLAIIDGGYTADAEQVRNIIAAHGNRIDTWIITHPHPDHVGAFNVIAADLGDITIDHIYSVDVNYERYKETANPWDDFASCEEFFRVIENLEKEGNTKITYVHENDEFEMLGLDIKVLRAWDDEIDSLERNLCNKGSMFFVASGNVEKMLFCADVEEEVQQGIIDRHKEELDVDYLQAAHHGNWGVTTELYQHVTPRYVFFDSTDALLTPGDAGYDAGELKAWFEGQGVPVVNFSTAPNQVVMK